MSVLFEQCQQFSHREVRDLAWVISSPPLVSGCFNNTLWWDDKKCYEELIDCLSSLEKLDKNPEPLLKHLAGIKSQRLGHRFEAFVSFWLNISPNYKLLTQNQQIIIEGNTKGELDFVIQDLKTHQIIHLEVAVKFYLGSDSFSDPYRWFGTNTKDQLGRKIDRLKEHQTQLSLLYKEQMPYNIDEKHCLIKGRLFYPQTYNNEAIPEYVSENHLRGRWQYKDYIDNKTFIMIEKKDWLSTFTKADIDSYNVLNQPSLAKRAKCYIQIDKNMIEKERGFYLPKDFRFPDT